MMTIRPADAPQEDPAPNAVPSEMSPAPQPGKPRMPMVWIPATLCVGLLIAAVYLGGRIVTAHPHQSVPVKNQAAPVKTAGIQTAPQLAKPVSVVAPAVVPAKHEPKPEAPVRIKVQPAKLVTGDEVPMIEPKPGERYIQVGALDLEATRRYLGHLRQVNLEPHVAPGPKPELLRVLIGPFSDQDSLATAKQGLESAGIDSFVRKY